MHIVTSPAMPFWGHVPEGIHPGLIIHVDGYIPHHADRFDINLVKGHDVGHHAGEHSSIALHFNPRLNDDVIVLNSRNHKSWGHEDSHRHSHSLHRGGTFNVTIHVENDSYRISVNGNHLCHFHHRIPYHEVGVLWINGDVEVRTIEYRREHEHSSHFQPAHQPSFQPTNAFVPGHYDDPHHHSGHHHDHHHHHH